VALIYINYSLGEKKMISYLKIIAQCLFRAITLKASIADTAMLAWPSLIVAMIYLLTR